jgi:serine/threonine-protein kinase HipA
MAAGPRRVSAARVLLWGREVGAVAWDARRSLAAFEYAPSFLRDGVEVAPLVLPRRAGVVSFPELRRETFLGLPGLLADSIPDRFGNSLIDAWLLRHGRSPGDFTPVERLCYIGARGMGALEFSPALRRAEQRSVPLAVGEMVALAQQVLDERYDLLVNLGDRKSAVETIIRVGTSAGGARAKALVSWNRATNEIRSGQVPPPQGYESWILKFDGVRDRALGSPAGYGRVEYAYHLMAAASGITMTECRLFEENGRAHFMTRRFDRGDAGEKIHMQSLCALAHFDFHAAGAYGYEQAMDAAQRLGLGYPAVEELYRRMVFNIIARNQDDHTKNIAFLLDRGGAWRLAPAFDVIWAYHQSGPWTGSHQMTVNGKRDGFSREDLLAPAKLFGIKHPAALVERVAASVRDWPRFALAAGVAPEFRDRIGATHRLKLG